MTPTAARRGGEGETIRFAVGEASLGAMLVAATDKGVAAIMLGDDPDALVRELQDRFPRAKLVGGDAAFERRVAQVVGLVERPATARPAARYPRHRLPAAGLAGFARDPGRARPRAMREIAGRSAAQGRARRRPGLRQQSARGGHPVPPRRADRRRPFRLPLGRRAQARAARARGRAMTTAALDAAAVDGSIGGESNATSTPMARRSRRRLLAPEECRAIAALYPDDARFRSTVVMARHGFGRGEYKYFAYPLPDPVGALRRALSAARADRQPLERGDGRRRPAIRPSTRPSAPSATPPARRGRRRCCCATAPGDYNWLHQDLYGALWFPLQVAILLSAPGRDFAGGEFVLTEQRPRMQSRAEVVSLGQGDGVIFAVRDRPAQGARGPYRVGAAPRRQPDQERRTLHARRHLPRCDVNAFASPRAIPGSRARGGRGIARRGTGVFRRPMG